MKWLSGNIKKINIYSDTLNDGVINFILPMHSKSTNEFRFISNP